MRNKKRAFITGILGQDGAYLAQFLLNKNYQVFGLVRKKMSIDYSNTDYLGITQDIEFIFGDMTDEMSLINALKISQPDEIYNLAAQSFVGISWDLAKITTDINALGTLFLLEAMRKYVPTAKFYQASTSEMFGNSNINGKQTEETPFAPRSPYAISKVFAYHMTNNFKESYGMYCVNGILFNHESPIRGTDFVTRKISLGVAKIALGLASDLRLGDISIKRDWGFAGDYVEAMYLMLQQKKPDNYIISTGINHSIKDFLDIAFARVGIKNWKDYVVTNDPQFKRPSEVINLKGQNIKAKTKLKWKPKTNFKELVHMMVDADLERLKNKN